MGFDEYGVHGAILALQRTNASHPHAKKEASPALAFYVENTIIRTSMLADDLEHPDTLADAQTIERLGGFPFVQAIGELAEVVGCLFDGSGSPPHANASKKAQDVFFEHRPHQGLRMFTRQFWGDGGASVVAAVVVKNGRPALLSIVAVDLGPSGVAALDHRGAEDHALALARQRSTDM